jgi:SET domain-containing protein
MKHSENALIFSNGVVEVKDSKIHGLGLFSKKFIPNGFVLGAGEIDKSLAGEYEKKDLYGVYDKKYEQLNIFQIGGSRYINHCLEPNVAYQIEEKMIIAIAIKDIKPGEEITLNYIDHFTEEGLPLPDFLLKKEGSTKV